MGIEVAVFQAIRVALQREDLGVVDAAIDHRHGHGLIAEDLTPGRERLVGGDDLWPWHLAARSGLCLPFGPTTSSTSRSVSSCTHAQREQPLLRRPNELAERLLDFRWQRTLRGLLSRNDLEERIVFYS